MGNIIDREDYPALVKAAQIVPVFERNIAPLKRARTKRGCFNCDHAVGPMQGSNTYSTIFITKGDEPKTRLSMVVGLRDRFYEERPKHLVNKVVPMDIPPPFLNNILFYLDEMNEHCYVRIVYDWDEKTSDDNPKHINARINLKDYIKDIHQPLHAYATSAYVYGQYVDPTYDIWSPTTMDLDLDMPGPYAYKHMAIHPAYTKKIQATMGLQFSSEKVLLTRLENPKDKLITKKMTKDTWIIQAQETGLINAGEGNVHGESNIVAAINSLHSAIIEDEDSPDY